MNYRLLLLICFSLNGTSMLATKMVGEMGLAGLIPLVLLAMYGVAMAGSAVIIMAMRKPIERKSVGIGLMAAVGTSAGIGSNMAAAALLPAYTVFPIVQGGALLFVLIAGRMFFKEQIGIYGVMGVITGIAAIVMLSS